MSAAVTYTAWGAFIWWVVRGVIRDTVRYRRNVKAERRAGGLLVAMDDFERVHIEPNPEPDPLERLYELPTAPNPRRLA